MRTETERTEQTVAIGAALGLFFVLMVASYGAIWMLHTFTDAVDGRENSIINCATIVSGGGAVAYLARSRQRR